jgi:hypothetical protein
MNRVPPAFRQDVLGDPAEQRQAMLPGRQQFALGGGRL